MPWYLPVLATCGVLLMIASVRQRGGVLRTLAMIFFLAVCAFEWYGVVIGTKTPPYTGSVRVGDPAPAFSASRPDGSKFSNDELASGRTTALVFFRGRW